MRVSFTSGADSGSSSSMEIKSGMSSPGRYPRWVRTSRASSSESILNVIVAIKYLTLVVFNRKVDIHESLARVAYHKLRTKLGMIYG